MRIDILTLFPEMFTSFLEGSLIGAARSAGLLDIRVTNIRDFATGAHRQAARDTTRAQAQARGTMRRGHERHHP